MQNNVKVVVIGGSAGSLHVVARLITSLPEQFPFPVIIIMHRQKNIKSEMAAILATYSANKSIIEPEDKFPVNNCCIYLAPQNYHLLVEEDQTFSLDYSEPVQYSRPSIDVTFESVANIYKEGTVAILLSGANNDGSKGLKSVIENGGIGIVQQPGSAEFGMMPKEAIKTNINALVLSPAGIIKYLQDIKILQH